MKRSLRFEGLESRALLYAVSGFEWPDTNITFSFMPDGTIVPDSGYFTTATHESNLFSSLNNIAPPEVWQHEFARALQSWAVHTPINFSWVSDDGTRSGATQGDERFGDIRLGAHPRNWDNYVAYAYYPSGISSNGGNVLLNSDYATGKYSLQFKLGSNIDLFSTFMHETGHSLGLAHSQNSNAVMYHVIKVHSGLHQDDIDGIQAIYGERQHDQYDAIARNTTFETATILQVDADGVKNIQADLTTLDDIDYYRFTAPNDADGSLEVVMKSEGLSLLSPKLKILDSEGNIVAVTDSNGEYHTTITATIDNVVGGQDYIIVANNSRDDVFGIGGYTMDVLFGIGEPIDDPVDPPDDPVLDPDIFEPNNTIDTAAFLGQFNNYSVDSLTIHDVNDVDYYHFRSQARGFYSISLNTNDNLTLAVVDSQGNVLQQTDNNLIVLQLNNRENVFLRVSGDVTEYSLDINRTARMPILAGDSVLVDEVIEDENNFVLDILEENTPALARSPVVQSVLESINLPNIRSSIRGKSVMNDENLAVDTVMAELAL